MTLIPLARRSFLQLVFPDAPCEVISAPPVSGIYLRGGESPRHLCALPQGANRDSHVDSRDATPLCMALLNACSVANKLFLLNDFIMCKTFDFLFLTETLQRNMDLSPLIELCLKEYTFISSPRLSGHGGGLACRLVSTGSFSSTSND